MSKPVRVLGLGANTAITIAAFGPIAGLLSIISVPVFTGSDFFWSLSNEAQSGFGRIAEGAMQIASIVSIFGCILSVAWMLHYRKSWDSLRFWVIIALLNLLVVPTYLVLR